ncbi:predicted protein [Histoplasma mississippiense (nom. inval.)]|uniref:predicted protein n=1 Tax=Ajellomyces capsulatus (strain NAm1 / WU24) TaxID=2059318 RepID=UPI000157CED1|nr:predicted protein [Histoplasma mississippiense (nom. inval.)]EDN11350.1 predicted protein [Histoplasma mississippiense (nom. inval.)]
MASLSTKFLSRAMDYGPQYGSEQLSTPLSPENVLVTPGASLANFLIFYGMYDRGDHDICQYPTYQQPYTQPTALRADNGYRFHILDHDKFRVLLDHPPSTLKSIVQIAREHSITIIRDEVYRPLFHSITPADPEFPPIRDDSGLRERDRLRLDVQSLPPRRHSGRLALASPNVDLVRACEAWRAYTIVSASQIDRQIALYALHEGRLHNLLKSNNALARHNLALPEGVIEQNRWACESAKPVAGSVACVRFSKMGRLVDDVVFREKLFE